MSRRHGRVSTLASVWFLPVLLLLAFVVPTPSAFAQSGKGTITGRVTDPTGAVLQGAQISTVPTDSIAVSNAEGRFFINDLDPGSYTAHDHVRWFRIGDEDGGRCRRPERECRDHAFRFRPKTRRSWSLRRGLRPKPRPSTVSAPPTTWFRCCRRRSFAAFPTPIWPTPWDVCQASRWSATKARASTCRSGAPSRASPTRRSMGSTFPRRSPAFARSSSTPFPPTSSRPSKSTRRCRPTWMGTASAGQSIW